MISAILSRVIILICGILYPAYCSYKAIRTKNVKEYVRWMMHWVVFACFLAIETFTDVFLSWFPFYYEVKLSFVFWLLSPWTKGSSILYKTFIHPKLSQHEQEIDEYINQAKVRGYRAVIDVGTKTFDYASKLIVETAIKGAATIKKSYSLSDLTQTDGADEGYHQELMPVKHRARPKAIPNSSISTRSSERSTSLTKRRPNSDIYFPEVELREPNRRSTGDYSYMRSVEDISSGYSSTMDLSRSELSRTPSNVSLRSKRTTRDPMTVSSTLPRRRASEKSKVQRATK